MTEFMVVCTGPTCADIPLRAFYFARAKVGGCHASLVDRNNRCRVHGGILTGRFGGGHAGEGRRRALDASARLQLDRLLRRRTCRLFVGSHPCRRRRHCRRGWCPDQWCDRRCARRDNWQYNQFVFGLEGDFGWTNAKGYGHCATNNNNNDTSSPTNMILIGQAMSCGRVGLCGRPLAVFCSGRACYR